MHRASVLLAVAALALAGCGGSSSGGRLSEAEFVKKADAVCAKYKKKINALPQPSSLSGVAGYAQKAIDLTKQGRAELRALKPPSDLADTNAKWLANLDQTLVLAGELRDAAKQKDLAKVRTLAERGNRLDKQGNRLAAQMGMKACSED